MLKHCWLIFLLLAPAAIAKEHHIQPEKTIAEVMELLIAQGFHDIAKVEFDYDDDRYEIKARNTNNEKVEIEMTTSGKFIAIELD